MFALLPNKKEDTYNRLFREVRHPIMRQGNEPTDIHIDFEKAAINAVTNQMLVPLHVFVLQEITL